MVRRVTDRAVLRMFSILYDVAVVLLKRRKSTRRPRYA
jgi:hypothetical protein